MIGIDNAINKSNISLLDNPLSVNKGNKSVANSVASTLSADQLLTPEKTQRILHEKLVGKLEARFKEEGIELKGLDPDAFTPEKVSDRILSFVGAGIARGKDDEQRAHLLEQAREGIEKGFADAKAILESLDVLNGKVKDDIDRTYDLIQIGLDKFGEKEDQKPPEIGLINKAAAQSASISENRSTAVEIITNDGDKITINLERSQKQSFSQSSVNGENGSIYTAQYGSESYTSIHYKVDGDIDKDEQAAIDDLLEQLNGVAKDFYQGNMEDAFNKAKELGFNSGELAEFSVSMEHNQVMQSAASSYQNIQSERDKQLEQQAEQPVEKEYKNSNFVSQITHFMGRLSELLEHSALEMFGQSQNSMSDLLKASLSLQDKPEKIEDKVQQQKTVDEIVESVASAKQKKADDLIS